MQHHECLKALSRNLRRLRRELQYKQVDVATGAGISVRYYQDIEGGRINLTLRTLAKLAIFFKTTIADLLRGC